jgi:hypothetical protein
MRIKTIRYHFIRADKTVRDVCARFRGDPLIASSLTELNEGKRFPRDLAGIIAPPYDTWIWVQVAQDLDDDASWEWTSVTPPSKRLLRDYGNELQKGSVFRIPGFPVNVPEGHARLWLNYRNRDLRERILLQQGAPPPAHGDAALGSAIGDALQGGTGPIDDINPSYATLDEQTILWVPFVKLRDRLISAVPVPTKKQGGEADKQTKSIVIVDPPDNFDKLCRRLVNIYGICKWLETNKNRVEAEAQRRSAEIGLINAIKEYSRVVTTAADGDVNDELYRSLDELRKTAQQKYLATADKIDSNAFAEWKKQVRRLDGAVTDPELNELIQWVEKNRKGGNRVFSLPWDSRGSMPMTSFHSEILHLAHAWLMDAESSGIFGSADTVLLRVERALDGLGAHAGRPEAAGGPTALDYVLQLAGPVGTTVGASVGNAPGPATLAIVCVKLVAARRSFWAVWPDQAKGVLDKLAVYVRKSLGYDAFDLVLKWNGPHVMDKVEAIESLAGRFHTSPAWLQTATLASVLGLINAIYATSSSPTDTNAAALLGATAGTLNTARATLQAMGKLHSDASGFADALGPLLGHTALVFGAAAGAFAFLDARSSGDALGQWAGALQCGGSSLLWVGGVITQGYLVSGAAATAASVVLVLGNVLIIAGAAVAFVQVAADASKPGSLRVFEAYLTTFENGWFKRLADNDLRAKLADVRAKAASSKFLMFPETDLQTRQKLEKLRLPADYIDKVFYRTTRPLMSGVGDVLF